MHKECGYFEAPSAVNSLGYCKFMNAPANCGGQFLVCPELKNVLTNEEAQVTVIIQHIQTEDRLS